MYIFPTLKYEISISFFKLFFSFSSNGIFLSKFSLFISLLSSILDDTDVEFSIFFIFVSSISNSLIFLEILQLSVNFLFPQILLNSSLPLDTTISL